MCLCAGVSTCVHMYCGPTADQLSQGVLSAPRSVLLCSTENAELTYWLSNFIIHIPGLLLLLLCWVTCGGQGIQRVVTQVILMEGVWGPLALSFYPNHNSINGSNGPICKRQPLCYGQGKGHCRCPKEKAAKS